MSVTGQLFSAVLLRSNNTCAFLDCTVSRTFRRMLTFYSQQAMRSIAWNGGITFHFACPAVPVSDPELVVGWVHPWVGLGWVGFGHKFTNPLWAGLLWVIFGVMLDLCRHSGTAEIGHYTGLLCNVCCCERCLMIDISLFYVYVSAIQFSVFT